MDLLQRELERKKSLLAKAGGNNDDDASNTNTNTKKKRKYWKQSELRRFEEEEQEEQERQKRQKHQQERLSETTATRNGDKTTVKSKEASETTTTTTTTTTLVASNRNRRNRNQAAGNSSSGKGVPSETTIATAAIVISPQQVTGQLRALGLPVRFFGETHPQRLERLEVALVQQNQTLQGLSEMEEYRLGQGHGIRNTFLGSNKKDGNGNANANANGKQESTTTKSSKGDGKQETHNDGHAADEPEADASREEVDMEDTTDENDPPKRIYKFLKGLLKEWEVDLEARPSSVAKSVAGRNESKTLKQCKDYIRPLFRQLKRRKLEAGLQAHLIKIMECAQQGEFVKAHDAYMDVAIGRAAWPIGVTMVGIHARSGRAKIESSNVAHVMNSELQRKYLTSVKRLLSYAQKKRPDVDPSKKVT